MNEGLGWHFEGLCTMKSEGIKSGCLRAGDDLLVSSAVYDANRREDAGCK